jgi:hypothetical protein
MNLCINLSVPLSLWHALYIAFCSLYTSIIFFLHPTTAKLFKMEENFWTRNAFLVFSTSFFWNISHSENNSNRYYHKCTQGCYSCRNLLHFNFLDRFWKIIQKWAFRKNMSNWRQVVPRRCTDINCRPR